MLYFKEGTISIKHVDITECVHTQYGVHVQLGYCLMIEPGSGVHRSEACAIYYVVADMVGQVS